MGFWDNRQAYLANDSSGSVKSCQQRADLGSLSIADKEANMRLWLNKGDVHGHALAVSGRDRIVDGNIWCRMSFFRLISVGYRPRHLVVFESDPEGRSVVVADHRRVGQVIEIDQGRGGNASRIGKGGAGLLGAGDRRDLPRVYQGNCRQD